MKINQKQARNYLKKFDFLSLFIEELGWNNSDIAPIFLAINNDDYNLEAIAEKCGMIVYHCQGNANIPDHAIRRKIDKETTKYTREHLIIYTDSAQQEQVWQWVRREKNKPLASREQRFNINQSGDLLLQKLETLAFSLAEEESLTLPEVTGRARKAFDVDKVTKKFYEEFKKQHSQFLNFIDGITSISDQEWYASLMLNRLMFIYFMQKKGFLDENKNYLADRLKKCQEQNGKDKFHTFYRYFLIRLFHEGLGKPERPSELAKLLGKVPYLNGGLYEKHHLEEHNPDIYIPDEAFETIFTFFEGYDWHLDDRPVRSQKEINPDVLGYIFEKYTNQKQMGAYYTKEDITEYISKNCIIPFVFEEVNKSLFQVDGIAWRILRDDPDRYIYEAVLTGVDIPLPKEIEAGINDVSKRDGWNKSAQEDYALPTETWREHIARRQRCLELRKNIANGEITSANDLITYNLNMRQLAQDVIENCCDPEIIWAFYQAINKITVLDPTCGSGAFLFAALNILEPLYEACLEQMQIFIDDRFVPANDNAAKALENFHQIIEQINLHNNRKYFILKSIIINNLYGVDIMQEATEICKLRLYLKLASQIEADYKKPNMGIEPLPDIDFNIRAGNTLVGFTSLDEVKEAVNKENSGQLKLVFDDNIVNSIEAKAQIVDNIFQDFRRLQVVTHIDSSDINSKKAKLRTNIDELREELDKYLADEYELGLSKKLNYFKQWKNSHQPFHWFIEFYGVMNCGGFDVIIGNPPYLEKSKLSNLYTPNKLLTIGCKDIYAWVVERILYLKKISTRIGLIIPVSIVSSRSFKTLRDVIWDSPLLTWLSHFANRPGQLFDGAQNRLTILVFTNHDKNYIFSSRYYRWDAKGGERNALFQIQKYVKINSLEINFHGLLPKIGHTKAISVLRKYFSSKTIGMKFIKNSNHCIYWVRVPGYFCQYFLEPPMAVPENGGFPKIRGEVNTICLSTEEEQRIIHAVLNSTTYYLFFCIYTDCRHINSSDVKDFPLDINSFSSEYVSQLIFLSKQLETSMNSNKSFRRKSGLLIESVDSSFAKPIIDSIDSILAQHYGFTDEELDFIINYDIKYRMYKDSENED
ncbi:Eco57I restriction-modification methylase domain-containing protein [Nodularia sphaerocarpa]|uniref:Eco57I restriction-modification methylase domain-containing protein n=1 Tax=Nodularia sphaerocarpa TaxID=137816 RepID=UPI00232A7C34|nr:DNA methyltransferase [Nodularia sphaerocarpa]MDB9372336.1 Eco57I restriction-modification methylase domain-containing protein [Nodularia sphaerocarpa CS-585]MDB9377952.1 Eco57I restriction-modification methylase domain-containing protein [Nodularia sphaerocarpa CS-585A2]